MKRKRNKVPVINIVALILFIAAVVFFTIRYAPVITRLVSEPEKFRDLLISYGGTSILVFVLFQVMQVVVVAIPGELVQLAGGYVYGTVLGTLYSLTGILLGSIIVFYISRLLGFSIVKRFISREKLDKFSFLMNSQKSEIAMFILFVIPGLPKDILTYIAGLTPIKPLRFFVIITIGRFPALLGSSYIGAHIQEKQYAPVIIVSIIACVLFIVGVLAKEKIINKVSSFLSEKKDKS